MHPQKIQNVLDLPAEDRFHYFIRKIADFEELWGLFENGWAMMEDIKGEKSIPFWPEKDFCSLCKQDTWTNYSPKPVELTDFMLKWLPGMEKDGMNVAVFPTPQDKGVVLPPNEILLSLREELEQYE